MEQGEEFIIQYLMMTRGLIPSKKEIERQIEGTHLEHPILSDMPSVIIDDLCHRVQHFSEPDERRYVSLLNYYPWYLTTRTLFILRELLFQSIIRGTLTLDGLSANLWKHSRILMTRSDDVIKSDVSLSSSRIDVILPGIKHYFSQVQSGIEDAKPRPYFTLVVDSLVPKIEGMMRDLCASFGGVTTEVTVDRDKRSVQRAKGLHSLLYERVLLSVLDEDDLLFFRFLLVEQRGYNLRNRVAHGMTSQKDYSLDCTLLVLVTLFRVVRYQVAAEHLRRDAVV